MRGRLQRARWLVLVVAGGVAFGPVACTSSGAGDRAPGKEPDPRPAATPVPATPRRPAPAPRVPDPPLIDPETPLPSESLEAAVVRAALDLLGSPYRYAGATPRGFDCSGFVSYVFEGFDIELPRTTVAQSSLGTWIPLDEVTLGDLIFFADGSTPTHVGLVTSRPGQPLTMVHSSSSRGVIETVVEESDYWLERLRFARRHH